jgi:hypothetical protein
MQCELFEFSDEDFDTGIPMIDQVEEESAFQYELTMEPETEENEEQHYAIGEVVTQTFADYVMEGEVTEWNGQTRLLKLAHNGSSDGEERVWLDTMPIRGDWAELTPITITDGINEIQPLSQNQTFDDFANDFIDFTETNPFGDILQ